MPAKLHSATLMPFYPNRH